MDLLMRERQEFGLPVPGDVPFVTRISPLKSGMIATQLAAVQLEYGEEQEVVDGWRSMCERAVEERQDLLSLYA